MKKFNFYGFKRRKSKGEAQKEYDILNKPIKQMCAKAKEKMAGKQFTAIEQDSKSCVRCMYWNVQELTGDIIYMLNSAGIKSKNGKLLSEQTEVLSRWSEYTEELTTIETKN